MWRAFPGSGRGYRRSPHGTGHRKRESGNAEMPSARLGNFGHHDGNFVEDAVNPVSPGSCAHNPTPSRSTADPDHPIADDLHARHYRALRPRLSTIGRGRRGSIRAKPNGSIPTTSQRCQSGSRKWPARPHQNVAGTSFSDHRARFQCAGHGGASTSASDATLWPMVMSVRLGSLGGAAGMPASWAMLARGKRVIFSPPSRYRGDRPMDELGSHDPFGREPRTVPIEADGVFDVVEPQCQDGDPRFRRRPTPISGW